MDFICAGDEAGAEDAESGSAEMNAAPGEDGEAVELGGPGAAKDDAEGAVAEEVTGFAEDVIGEFQRGSGETLVEEADELDDPLAGMAAAHGFGGFAGDYGEAEEDGVPGKALVLSGAIFAGKKAGEGTGLERGQGWGGHGRGVLREDGEGVYWFDQDICVHVTRQSFRTGQSFSIEQVVGLWEVLSVEGCRVESALSVTNGVNLA